MKTRIRIYLEKRHIFDVNFGSRDQLKVIDASGSMDEVSSLFEGVLRKSRVVRKKWFCKK